MSKSKKNNEINLEVPSVLAFEKKLVPSDAYMYGTIWEEREEKSTQLKIKEKSMRGTIANRLLSSEGKDPAKLDADINSANLQTIDDCALEEHQDTLKLHFTLKILSDVKNPSACNNQEFGKKYESKIEQYIAKYGFTELAKRYAINLANARFLWRNRIGADEIKVCIKELKSDSKYEFDALSISIKDFDCDNNDLQKLAEKIAQTLAGEEKFLMLDITTYAKIGKSQPVYPSEELVLDKSKSRGEKSKILYSVNDGAAMHSQKIGNAIRTIDNWYGEANDYGPISVESYGSVTTLGKSFRTPKTKSDFFSLFDSWIINDKELTENEQHYCMAMLLRGGVFGKSNKKAPKGEPTEGATEEAIEN